MSRDFQNFMKTKYPGIKIEKKNKNITFNLCGLKIKTKQQIINDLLFYYKGNQNG